MSNVYHYNGHNDLTPAELFLFIAIQETSEHLGIDNIEYLILIFSGLNILPTRAKPSGATPGTSVASVMARSLFKYKFRNKILPTFTIESMKAFRWVLTHKLSTFVGRTLPGVGWVLMTRDIYEISSHTVIKYNRIAKPEDRVF
ncbi:hypothetical protein WM03_09540 [Burkholderia ubonensis]|uniref:STM2901 family protein n=1 Tax=Burkholderia ubonensis TaxID=101571 RepID=UPI000753B773|nr:hypothetical protein [Burkholderia ubonensis]KVC78088.1 hypothetical protein WI75_13655 [Burkholderia ubonensis]KVG76140.1 hypothetical protein WJ34_05785 [Burkholderia ubonensis]KVH21366.1 hypothetical protein WJ37_15510 [Burkholderia ubonensis]KVH47680.1 hypothetical protein WJ38_18800 [Burkholderia ubonensis]KVH83046.1 hypothetical protein WJ43_21535 [Burkholderia ubonensis]